MLEWAPGPDALFEWTQEWIQTLNKAQKDEAPTFTTVQAPPSALRRNGSCSSAGESILRNGYKKKRSVSWSKTIEVETFQAAESRDDTPLSTSESEGDSEESYDELDISRSYTMDNDATDKREPVTMGDDEADKRDSGDEADNRESGNGNQHEETSFPAITQDESEDDVFAQIECSFHEDDVYELVSASSTLTDATKQNNTITVDEPRTPIQEKVKASSVFIPVLLPNNFRLENRLGKTDSGSFCTLSEDDRSLISNIDDTASLVARRAASDDESIVSLRKRNKEYDDIKQREIDGVLGHLGLVLPLPSLKGLWSSLGNPNPNVDKGALKEAVSSGTKVIQDGGKAPRAGGISEAASEVVTRDKYSFDEGSERSERSDGDITVLTVSSRVLGSESSERSDGDITVLTVSSRVVGKSQDELGSEWSSRRKNKEKKSRFGMLTGRFASSRKKAVGEDCRSSNKRRSLFKMRSKKSKAPPQLLI
jgi:hypothetical protein